MESAGVASGPAHGPRGPRVGAPRGAPSGPSDAAGGAGGVGGADSHISIAGLSAGVFRVKSETNAKSLSGAISAQARAGEKRMVVNGIGAGSVNQAIKAIIIARGNVQADNLDFTIKPEVLTAVGPDAVAIHVSRIEGRRPAIAADASVQLRVTATTKPGAVAGAIAGKAREGPAAITVTGIGPGAVLRAVKGIFLASSYLAGDSLGLTVAPTFVDLHVGPEEGGEERTGVQFEITVQKLEGEAAAAAAALAAAQRAERAAARPAPEVAAKTA